MKFSSYSINERLLKSINELGYYETTPIQEATLAKILKGKSLIAKSETGSGKTHAYLIPTLSNLNRDLNKTQIIIVEPTLELCAQCEKFAQQIESLSKDFRVYNATGYKEKQKLVFDRPSLIITTPGKLRDLLFVDKILDIQALKSLVLDEADMLLEGDDAQDMISLVDHINPKQLLVFTATMKEHQIASLKKLFHINELIDVDKKNFTSKNVEHHLVDIKHRSLTEALLIFLKTVNPYFTLAFCSKKEDISKIYRNLSKEGIKCAYLSSEVSLRERKNTLKRINDGEFELVLCSDLASRGLDFEKVSHVISLDVPSNIDYYYHRAGRTGRYKSKGDSYIFYDDDLNKKGILLLQKKITFNLLVLRNEGLKPDRKHTPKPKKKNEKLEAEIKKELAKVRSKKVKPNYKKKMRKAVAKATKRHKRQIIMQNLRSKRKAMASLDD